MTDRAWDRRSFLGALGLGSLGMAAGGMFRGAAAQSPDAGVLGARGGQDIRAAQGGLEACFGA